MPDSDAHLARRAAHGDTAALEALYRRHVDKVWRYAWFRSRSREAAAEVVQETFLRVTRSIRRFEGRSAFTTWLFAVARSAAIEVARREHTERANVTEPRVLRLIPAAKGKTDSLSDEEVKNATRRAVAQLPGAQRDAIVLCELSGLSVRDAAEVLDWSESRVKVTLFRARRRLRDRLQPYVAEESAERRRDRNP